MTQVLEFFQKTTTITVGGSLAVCSNHSNVFIAGLSVSLNYTQSELTLTLYCTTTGLPPTTVTWSKDGVDKIRGDNYVFSQRVIDVNNTVYESILILDWESACDIQGLYQCIVQCHDDIGELVKNATDSVSITGEFY